MQSRFDSEKWVYGALLWSASLIRQTVIMIDWLTHRTSERNHEESLHQSVIRNRQDPNAEELILNRKRDPLQYA